jgi:hypothetical protein
VLWIPDVYYPRIKKLQREAEHLPSSNTMVENVSWFYRVFHANNEPVLYTRTLPPPPEIAFLYYVTVPSATLCSWNGVSI